MSARGLAILAAVAVAAVAAYVYLSRPGPVAITTVTVERGDVIASVTNTRAGTVDACRRAGIAPATGGPITALYVADGDRVEQGALLLELWNRDLAASLKLAQSDVAAARSRSREVCVTARVAKREAERLTSLRARNLASEEQADRAVGEAESRAAACDAAQDAALVSAAAVEVAEANLERTRLRAPFSGIVAEINGELGEFVTPSPVGIPTLPTVDLIDPTCLYISAPIDEVDAPAVAPGLKAWISLDAFPERRFAGHVRRVAPYVLDVEKQSRTVEVEAVIDDPDSSLLLPGYSADVEVLLDARESVLRVPTPVIVDRTRVLVYDRESGLIEERGVETGLSNWEFTEVTAGLREGERVVSSVDRAGVEPGARAVADDD